MNLRLKATHGQEGHCLISILANFPKLHLLLTFNFILLLSEEILGTISVMPVKMCFQSNSGLSWRLFSVHLRDLIESDEWFLPSIFVIYLLIEFNYY